MPISNNSSILYSMSKVKAQYSQDWHQLSNKLKRMVSNRQRLIETGLLLKNISETRFIECTALRALNK